MELLWMGIVSLPNIKSPSTLILDSPVSITVRYECWLLKPLSPWYFCYVSLNRLRQLICEINQMWSKYEPLNMFICFLYFSETLLRHGKEFFFSFIFISWRLTTLQYCIGFCHTLTWISHGFTCIPHPDPPSHLPLYPIPLGLPSAPGTCLMHPAWTGDLFHPR